LNCIPTLFKILLFVEKKKIKLMGKNFIYFLKDKINKKETWTSPFDHSKAFLEFSKSVTSLPFSSWW